VVIYNGKAKILSEKFLNLYNKNVRINASKTGRIRVLMEFESIERIYDYLDIEN